MGLDYLFHAQRRNGDSWVAVEEFDAETRPHTPRSRVTWFDDKDVTVHHLFVGDQAIFPLHREQPPEFEITEFFLDGPLAPDILPADAWHRHNDAFADWYYGWIGLDELVLDCWPEQQLIVRKHVPIEMARFFLDGDRRFPRAKLIESDFETKEVDQICDTSYYSYDRKYDSHGYSVIDLPVRWQLSALDSDALDSTVPVSWKTTLSEFIGEWRMKELRRLSLMHAEVRIICLFC